jgi:hypothetical protein
VKWPRSTGVQILIALLGAIVLTPILTLVFFYLSAEYFEWKYPHDGQNVLGAVVVALFSCPFTLIGTLAGLFGLQRGTTRVKDRP